jgi:uncharacterized repeat protein (TIGR04076 family)
MKKQHDEFMLYDLHVEVVGEQKTFVCSHHKGDGFDVEGENFVFSKKMKFSLYALSALLPLIPAKQRETHRNDWMSTDAEVACPDPNCTARFRITRISKRKFRHSEVTKVPRIKTFKRKKKYE